MKLAQIAEVKRGVATGDRELFVMTRAEARKLRIEQFAQPILYSARELRRAEGAVVRDHPAREVIIVANLAQVEEHTALRAHLGKARRRVATPVIAPIAVTYVGVPCFVANPDGLVILNGLYGVTPRQRMTNTEVRRLVERLNAAVQRMPRKPYGQREQRWTPRQLEGLDVS